MRTPKRRQASSVNAGSMADIAFMLLIFFLVTTTMDQDQGITVKLPPWQEVDVQPPPVNPRNIFMIHLNAADQLLVRGEAGYLSSLTDRCKEFVLNPSHDPTLSAAPNKAVIAIKSDRNTTYEAYIQVYDRIKSAYTEMWSDISMRDYGKPYSDALPSVWKKAIRDQVPFIVSESESTDHKPID